MLPEEVSDLLSLNENEHKPTICVEFAIDNEGHIIDKFNKFERGLVKNSHAITY
jgi:exoribonuclease R